MAWRIPATGTLICEKSLDGATPTECCADEATYTVSCTDRGGNGWNGYKLYLGGVEVCRSFTSGSSLSNINYVHAGIKY